MGQTKEATGRAVGVARQQISEWERLPQWQEEWTFRLDEMKNDTRQVCAAATHAAAATIQAYAQGIGDPILNPATGEPTYYATGKDGKRREKREPVDPKLRYAACLTLLKIEGIGNEDRVVVSGRVDTRQMTDEQLVEAATLALSALPRKDAP